MKHMIFGYHVTRLIDHIDKYVVHRWLDRPDSWWCSFFEWVLRP